MKQTKGAIGNLLNRYRAVLKKCHLLNTFGSLAVAGMLVMGGVGVAQADIVTTLPDDKFAEENTTYDGQYKGNLEEPNVTPNLPGALVISNVGGVKIGSNAIFQNYATAVQAGGAVKILNGMTIEGGAQFIGNQAQAHKGQDGNWTGAWGGGALYIKLFDSAAGTSDDQEVLIGSEDALPVIFKENEAQSRSDPNNYDGSGRGGVGGAIAIEYADKVTITNTHFIQNSANFGGAVASWRTDWKEVSPDHVTTLNISHSLFDDNTAEMYGGAVANLAGGYGGSKNNTDKYISSNNIYKNNAAKFAGAVYNQGVASFDGDTFEGNTADTAGGAIYNAPNATIEKINNTTFKNNSSEKAGAINNFGGTIKEITGSTFSNNKATSSMGGAISNQKGTYRISEADTKGQGEGAGEIGLIADTWFTDNTAHNGGAINNGEEATINEIRGSHFIGNKAVNKPGKQTPAYQGGAITNAGTIKLIKDTEFIDNETSGNGGAIANLATGTLTLDGVTVRGNKAGTVASLNGNGGGIYNAGTLTFDGTNTFSGNTAAGEANDIYNQGKVSIAGGSTTLGSGYVQASGGSSPADGPSLTVNDGATLTLQGEATLNIQNGNVTFADNSTFMADASKMTGDSSAITLGSGTTMTVGDKAKLVISNAVSGDTYTVVTDNSGKENGEWKDVSSSTDLIRLDKITEGTDKGAYKATANDATQAFTGLSSDIASQINAITEVKGDRAYNSEYAGVRFLARATENNTSRFLGNDKAAAVSTIESAARIAFAGAVPQMTKMASDSATNAVVNRMGFANPENGAKAVNVDGKLVDDKALGLALWIAPLWSNQTGFGMEAGNLDYGYNANIGGVSLGADYTWANNFRAGLMFNIGGGYAESSGDLSETTNSMTFWGVGAYGGWKYENFAIMGDVSYTSTWNSVDQDLDQRMQMGDLEADIQASAISAGLRFEYKLETQYLDFIPHVGARYMSINTWGYDVDSADGTILEGDGFQQNIWTFPVGITFSKELEMNNDWYFKPSVDFTVIPAAGDIKAKEDVRFTGPWANSAELETQMMDYFTWQGGVGLEFGNDNMSVGVNYTLQAGQNSTGHGVFGMFRYEF